MKKFLFTLFAVFIVILSSVPPSPSFAFTGPPHKDEMSAQAFYDNASSTLTFTFKSTAKRQLELTLYAGMPFVSMADANAEAYLLEDVILKLKPGEEKTVKARVATAKDLPDGKFGVVFGGGQTLKNKAMAVRKVALDAKAGKVADPAATARAALLNIGSAPANTKSGAASKSPAPAAGQKEVKLVEESNPHAVSNNPLNVPGFVLKGPHVITHISTYHWNGGKGANPGTICIYRGSDKKLFGPWQAVGTSGQGGAQNVNWHVYPNVELPAGTYLVMDSDAATWSHNDASNNTGFFTVYGYAVK